MSNTLPTRVNLYKRRIIDDPMFPLCKSEEESVSHALRSCLAIRNVWTEKASPVQKWQSDAKEFQQMWMEMYEGLTKEKLELTMTIMNKIWGRRNRFLFENKFSSLGRVVQGL